MSDKEKIKDAYKSFAEDLEEIEEEDKKKRKEVLRDGVLEIEREYREEIKGTHAVDKRLVKLRQEAGIPELIGTGDRVQKSRFKDKKKFYQFLAKEILEVGIEESRKFGGIMTYADFCKLFAEKRPNWEAPPTEIKKALEELAVAGFIPKMYRMKKDVILITFKPTELQSDLLRVLNVASGRGVTSLSEIMTLLGWQKERAELALYALKEQEIAIYDEKTLQYFFPAFRQ